jgi:hypothetical protein
VPAFLETYCRRLVTDSFEANRNMADLETEQPARKDRLFVSLHQKNG